LFEPLFAHLVRSTSEVTERQEGVAFFRVAKDLYGIDCLLYFCVNIPGPAGLKQYTHCVYSDTRVMHCLSQKPVGLDIVERVGLSTNVYRQAQDWSQNPSAFKPRVAGREPRGLTLPLRPRVGESAFVGMAAEMELCPWEAQEKFLLRELRILANYFHSHILRINGCDSEADILISAKELDCLKWTAAGKTAWEASVILSISERTVRFHLNMAREKLNCATTTQAVAKAVANQLIDV
jgi:DNA-binding CsgD family transcriptional regulator